MPEILGVNYVTFGPGNFFGLLKQVKKAKLLIPTAKEVMQARVTEMQKRGDGTEKSHWLDHALYVSDGLMRWKDHKGSDWAEVAYSIGDKSWIEMYAQHRKKGGEEKRVWLKEDTCPWEVGTENVACLAKIPFLELLALQEREVFQNLRLDEIPSNGLWLKLARGDKNLLEHYAGAMAIKTQRANRLGISSLMGIDIHQMNIGELSPLVMAPPSYTEDADVRTYARHQGRAWPDKVYLMGMEERLPKTKFNDLPLKEALERAPIAGVVAAGFRHLAGMAYAEERRREKAVESYLINPAMPSICLTPLN